MIEANELEQKIDFYSELKEKISTKTITVAVIGLGYVGLPFLVEKAKVGLNVIGVDINQERVEKLLRGENYIEDVCSVELKDVVDQGLVRASADFEILQQADVIVICVPTPLDINECPDLQCVEAVCENIAENLQPGQLICLESTTYPGTTEEIIKPTLEATGEIVGETIFLAFSPERVDPGNKYFNTQNTNKVVGGVDKKSGELAKLFYKLAIKDVVMVRSAKIAEMTKVYENTFRAVNIALTNEMAIVCDKMNINVWEVLDAAYSKPFGIMPFYPGPGVGGHCIPIDLHYLEWKAKEFGVKTRFISLASEINQSMPQFVIDKTIRILNKVKKSLNGASILMLGMAYKRNISDYRESPAWRVFSLLKDLDAKVCYHDKLVPKIEMDNISIRSVPLSNEAIKDADLVLITTPHEHIDYKNVVELAKAVLDTRYVTKGISNDKITLL